MDICIDIYRKLLRISPFKLYERGGILGGKDGVVTKIAFDKGFEIANRPCCYSPNVDYLNEIIEEWQNEGCLFMGLFHTHIGYSKELSYADRVYITNIMLSMPRYIQSLYFPIISLPEKSIECYIAKYNIDEVFIDVSEIKLMRSGQK